MNAQDTTLWVTDSVHLPLVMPADSADALAHAPRWNADTLSAAADSLNPVGAMGEPVHYRVGTDDVVSLAVVVMLVVALAAMAASWGFASRQVKNFFYRENERTTTTPDTDAELRAQWVLVGFTAFVMSVAYYAYATWQGEHSLHVVSRHLLLGICLATMVVYMLVKAMLYQWVNWIFFDSKDILQWNKSQLFILSVEGLAATPLVLLFVYGNIPLEAMAVGIGIVIILCKILTFYKSFLIFFRRMGAILQIFLYFCALELIPLAALVGSLEIINRNLIINF